jgi:hypothetical protein
MDAAPSPHALQASDAARARRRVLAAAGIAGFASLAAGIATPASAAPGGLGARPFVRTVLPNEDLAAVLAETPQVELTPGATYTVSSTIQLPSGTFIEGNGAVITVADDWTGALTATGAARITLRNIRFVGRSADPLNMAPSYGHVAVRLARCTEATVTDCSFEHWLGAGLVVTGSSADNYFAYRVRVSGCAFERCYFGMSMTDRSEYSLLTGSIFSSCRLAIWNSSGNWSITGNVVVDCYGAYYSVAATSPYGAQSSDNWNHGALVGNTFNHSNGSGGPRWTSDAAFAVGGTSRDLGPGIMVENLLPPTFTGNTLWYSNIRAVNIAGSGWVLTGCALSNMSITNTGTNPIQLLGYQSNGAANGPQLSGNVVKLVQ